MQDLLTNFAKSHPTAKVEPVATVASNNSKDQQGVDLSTQQVSVDKASGFIASSQTFQNQVTTDLKKYEDSGIQISSTAPASGPPATFTKVPLPTGIQSGFVTVTIKNPVDYNGLLKFIRAIETNIPKIRITGLNIKHVTDSDSSITVDPIVIEVYKR